MNNMLRPFHLAFPVRDINEARNWYVNILGCSVGRESEEWIDFNMFGHQIVAHLSTNCTSDSTNEVDGKQVPVRHFGVILSPSDWDILKDKLSDKITFLIAPNIRFEGTSGEQKTMFITDPSGNCLEFKSFCDDKMIFEK